MASSSGTAHRTLLVSDLDGTLLRPDATLGPTTLRIVNDFIDGGGLFTYATARSFTSASRVTHGLHLELPVVTYGGAVTVDPRSGIASAPEFLPASATGQVLEATSGATQVDAVAFAMHEGRDRVCWLEGRSNPSIETFLQDRRNDHRLLPLRNWSQIDTAAIFYLVLLGDHASLADLRPRVSPPGCHLTFSEDVYHPDRWWLELSSLLATKATALAKVKSQLGADRLVSFGDNHNDLPMFAMSEHAVAVANAIPEVQSAADEVIGANDTESVATWIADHSQMGQCTEKPPSTKIVWPVT